jgi:cytochrome c biogenesis protein
MKLFSIQKSLKLFTGVKFAILILAMIGIASSLGSFIEQDESILFYQKNYPTSQPFFGFITWEFIREFGLDHVYRTWWFFGLLFFLVLSLISCTFTRQFPIFSNSKEYSFRQNKKSFLTLPFSIKLKKIFYLKENIISKLQNCNFYLYQKENLIYGYKGLIGRISPILVHFSLILILLGSFLSSFQNLKAQEILPKGELFHIQNSIQLGWLTKLPTITTRINDFWVEYEENRIHQFYSNLSIFDNFGNEQKQQTISVNHPLHFQNLDFYQSDWNLLGIRFEDIKTNKIYESPFFPLEKASKSWITWIPNSEISLIFDQFQNTFLLYDKMGNFLELQNIGDKIGNQFVIIDILPSTGLQIKYDPTISLIYFGFGILMITGCLSFLPYTQIWMCQQSLYCRLAGSTNRGKIQLEIEFENLLREIETKYKKVSFVKKLIEN